MSLRTALAKLLGRRRERHGRDRPSESEAENARKLEQLIQSGVAANKFPPR
ncbi:MAG TPA: hypothetical protein VFB25_03565 [Gaiellaceae bacterium]|nr:hypothetical protein [Gaiellaceae bacterium]